MNTLQTYIKSQPEKTMAEWAKSLGVSRPMLYGLLSGDRAPSPEKAHQIEIATGGAVKVTDWPNIAAYLDAASGRGAA